MGNYNNIWTFGCSFTHCWGVNKDTTGDSTNPTPMYWSDKYDGYRWTVLLSNILQAKLYDRSSSGIGNEQILYHLIENLQHIQENDLVIIGLSTVERMMYIHDENNDYQVRTITGVTIERRDMWLWECYSKSDREAINNYYLHLYPDRTNINWKYQKDYALNLQKHLKNINRKCIIWDHTIFWKYQNIQQWTANDPRGQVPDGHWSPNGCIDFTSLLLYALDNDIEYIDINVLEKAGKGIYGGLGIDYVTRI